MALGRRLAPDDSAVRREDRLGDIVGEALAPDRPRVGVQQPVAEQERISTGMPPAAWKWFTSALPLG